MASMTASEMRDRLDHRFRLLVGSRRGLERDHTLRHAVAWSYDLLDEAERSLLDRCSVFAGGFDLQSACAVSRFDDLDEDAILDLLRQRAWWVPSLPWSSRSGLLPWKSSKTVGP
jgi:predicted ATPase